MALSMRDEPGTQREFETIFILRPDTNQDGIQSVNTRVRGVIDSMGGTLAGSNGESLAAKAISEISLQF